MSSPKLSYCLAAWWAGVPPSSHAAAKLAQRLDVPGAYSVRHAYATIDALLRDAIGGPGSVTAGKALGWCWPHPEERLGSAL